MIGGGQGGIGLGARLRQLGVPTIIVEKNERAGDSWRKRYKSLCLHDPVWYDHLPYIKFPENWPVFSPKDKIGDWLEMYTKVMELNYWTSTECLGASYDDAAGEWTVDVVRHTPDGDEAVTLRPKHLVLATGMSGRPNVPEIPGAESFTGDLHHSSAHRESTAYAGKNCVVLGSNNSAHDICAALWESGAAEVTMIQRSSTHIARSDTLMELALGDLYSERAVASGVTTEMADMIFASIPYRIMHQFQIPVYEEMARQDADFYADLEKAGFLLAATSTSHATTRSTWHSSSRLASNGSRPRSTDSGRCTTWREPRVGRPGAQVTSRSAARSRSSGLRTLLDAVRGRSSTTHTWRGTL